MDNLFSENIQKETVNETYVRKIKLLDQLVYSIEEGFVTYDKISKSDKAGFLGDRRTVSFKENVKYNPKLYLEVTENESGHKTDDIIGVTIILPFLKNHRFEYTFPLDYTQDDLTTLFGYLKESFQSKKYTNVKGINKQLF